jgi:hypothetical protein
VTPPRPLPDPSPPRRVFDVNGYGGFLYMVVVGIAALIALAATALWHGVLWLADKIANKETET